MKKLKILGFLLVALAVQISYAQSAFSYKDDFDKVLLKTKDPDGALSYEKLAKRFHANDTTMTDFEVLAMMIGFTDSKEYKPYEDVLIEREIYSLNEEEKYQEAFDAGIEFIETHPLSVKVLFEIVYSCQQLEKEDLAQFYAYKGQRIFEAMFFSGDGRTIDTPAFALGPGDGQDFVYKVVGATIGTMGSGRDKNGNFIDILEAKFEDGNTMNLYFIIQHATNKMFVGESGEEGPRRRRNKNK